MSDSLQPHGMWSARLLYPWNSPGKNTGVSCHALLQEWSSRPKDRTSISCIGRQFLLPLVLPGKPSSMAHPAKKQAIYTNDFVSYLLHIHWKHLCFNFSFLEPDRMLSWCGLYKCGMNVFLRMVEELVLFCPHLASSTTYPIWYHETSQFIAVVLVAKPCLTL